MARPEVVESSQPVKHRPPPPPIERVIYSISEFCQAHGISRATYYRMKQNGTGPREMRVGDRGFVSVEAAAKWRKSRERAAAKGS